jgi:hypothetical protein
VNGREWLIASEFHAWLAKKHSAKSQVDRALMADNAE